MAIGERSLPASFDGVLPWGWVDNRPFLRCLHDYGLCLWRLGRLAEAATVFEAPLWLNPTDNQGARFLVEDIRAGVGWDPPNRDDADDLIGRGAGRRALLDRSAAILDAPPRTPSQDAIETGFGPLLWLLERGRDGLPLTQTGALGQVMVREAAARFPGWWDSELFGALHREAVGPHIIDGDTFDCEVAELASAALLVERQLDSDALAATVHGAVAGSLRTADGPVTQRHVKVALAPFLSPPSVWAHSQTNRTGDD